MNYNLRVVTAAPYYPVSRDEAKDWLRVDSGDTSQDSVIDLLVGAITDHAENITGRVFVQRSYEMLMDYFPSYEIIMPRAPLLTVDYVKYYDINNVLQTLGTSIYEYDIYREPGRLRPAVNESWENTYSRMNAVQIGFTAGYAVGSPADAAAYREAVPDNLKLWMHARIATLYENREQLIQSNKVQIPFDFADGMLDNLKILEF